MMLLLILTTGLPITFPHGGAEAGHYFGGMCCAETTHELLDWSLQKWSGWDDRTCSLVSIAGGMIIGNLAITTFFRQHYLTDREKLLGYNGVAQWAGVRLIFHVIIFKWR